MTEQKESSPADSAVSSIPSFSSSSSSRGIRGNDVSRSSSGDIGIGSCITAGDQLRLQVPAHHPLNSFSTGSTSSSQQSSPRPSTTTLPDSIKPRTRGNSSSSSLSIGEISYRDLSDIQDEFKIVKILHDGSFSKILLTKKDVGGSGDDSEDSSADGTSGGKGGSGNNNKHLVLKAIPSGGLFTENFKRELRYNYFLSPHPNIVTSFNISFNWASCFNVYVQEHAPFGDLSRYVNSNNNNANNGSNSLRKCLPECQVKLIASQLASALEFMHSFKLVHQDVRAENVLIFKSNMSRVKLCDFGSTRKEGTLITKGNLISSSASSTSLLAPELSYLLPQERYECHRSSDVWQMGILLCICLTGKYPWDVAEFSDPTFRQYTSWLKRKSLKVPDPFRKFTPRLVRLLKRLLEPKQHLRCEIREVFKYLSDDWTKPNCNRMSIGNSSNGGNNSFRNKKASALLHNKKRESHSSINNEGNIGVGSSSSNKNGNNKLMILTSNGINLLSNHSSRKCSTSSSKKDEDLSDSNNKQKESRSSSGGGGIVKIEAGQENEDGEEGDNMTKRVEKWVASAARVAVVLQQGNETTDRTEIESNAQQKEEDD